MTTCRFVLVGQALLFTLLAPSYEGSFEGPVRLYALRIIGHESRYLYFIISLLH
jgi:hypothetical protein